MLNLRQNFLLSELYLLDEALEVDIKQPVHFSVVVIIPLAAFNAEYVIPDRKISHKMFSRTGHAWRCMC